MPQPPDREETHFLDGAIEKLHVGDQATELA